MTFVLKVTLVQLPIFFLNISFVEYKSCLLEENFKENLMKNTPT